MEPGRRSRPGCGVLRRGCGCHGVVEGVVVDLGGPLLNGLAGRGGVGGYGERHGVFVEGERGNGSSVGPLQVVPAPGLAVGLVEIEGVVAHHAAFHGAHAGLLHLLRHEVQHVDGFGLRFRLGGSCRTGCGGRRAVGIVTRAQGGVARAKQDQVAVEHALAIDFAASHHVGGPGERIRGEQGKGRGGGEQLGVEAGMKRRPSLKP